MLDTLEHDCEEARRWAEKANRDADSHCFKFVEERVKRETYCKWLTKHDVTAALATGPEQIVRGCNHDWNRAPFTTRIVADRLKEVTREFFRLKMSVTVEGVTDDRPQVVNLWLSVREKIHLLSKWVYAAAEDTESVAIGEILRVQEASYMPRENTALWHYLQEKTDWWELWKNDRVGVASSVRGLRIPIGLIDRVILKKPWYGAFESAAIVSAQLVGVMTQSIIIDRYLNVTGPEDSGRQYGTLVANVQAASGVKVDEKTEEFTKKDIDGFKRLLPNIQDMVRGFILTAAVVTDKISGSGLFGKLFTAPVFPNTSGLAVLPLGLCNLLPLKPGDSVWILEPSRTNGCWSFNNALFVQPRLQREPIDDDDSSSFSGTSKRKMSSPSAVALPRPWPTQAELNGMTQYRRQLADSLQASDSKDDDEGDSENRAIQAELNELKKKEIAEATS